MSWQHCFKPGSKCRLYGTLLSHLFSPIKSRKTLTFHLWRAQASYIAGSSTTSSLLFALVGIRPDPLARACRRGAVAFSSASHLEDVTAAAVFDQLVKEVHARPLPAEPPSRVPGTRGLCGCPTPASHPTVSVSTREPCLYSRVAGSWNGDFLILPLLYHLLNNFLLLRKEGNANGCSNTESSMELP